MNTKLFVGNLSFNVTENDLEDLFTQCGPVSNVNLILDRVSGRPRGFAFVTMQTEEGATAAIEQLHGKNVEGRDMVVNEAREREARPGGGGGGDRGPRGDRGDRGGYEKREKFRR